MAVQKEHPRYSQHSVSSTLPPKLTSGEQSLHRPRPARTRCARLWTWPILTLECRHQRQRPESANHKRLVKTTTTTMGST
ncbi:hypothetical protein CpipJ_CPIJ004059 [Culex quinquefasciatus]|uniref:Uncharacterized protein n=1 Tax=Culex quinquefasciatus TaxID=7176 RepID=B0WAF5_CULQU|nr:hypothetical protein CpipJ_CPIJ004059 [Culex quinquefasciatus]|eukprot:XP_001845689.1 hypothetical protein CpipJ_CPIJ004059 [Culex quinquefasciatus]